ncbi:hypothetical protein PDJ96_05750 [Bacillus cereus group sp. BY17LC]|uniref:hypothetical protein n=1 Tax=Bacillus cereus group sp. BY17LC TaxID=3018082 RepID=UPI0022E7B49D|nr:hypothetical protein [Bacillus cereus group sp. BY17LC]MDA1836230.1 hypothetical protein [Bacillus cereus group sp. BY17LC]
MLKYYTSKNIDEHYWRELAVPVDSINELGKEELLLNHDLNKILEKMKIESIGELVCLYLGENQAQKTEDKKSVQQLFIQLLTPEQKKEFKCLYEFAKRKKQYIKRFYNLKMLSNKIRYDSHELAQLKHLLNQHRSNLIELYTFYLWSIKGTGAIYSASKKISLTDAKKIYTEYKSDFINYLYKHAGNKEFKVRSYTALEDGLFIQLYKQVSDVTREDFDSALRNKEPMSILLHIDCKNRLVEIKSCPNKDEKNIISFLEEAYKLDLDMLKVAPFTEYAVETIKSAFINGCAVKENVDKNLVISRIAFKRSSLKNFPSIVFELDDYDIWPSVRDAYEKKCINLNSLKDISSITMQIGEKKRNIKGTVLGNGNVVFTMDDSRIDKVTKDRFIAEFKKQFGLPLFQEISNTEFIDGQSDKVDYLMGLTSSRDLSTEDQDMLGSLCEMGYIKKNSSMTKICRSCEESFELEKEEDLLKCDSCGGEEFIKKKSETLHLEMSKINRFVKKTLTSIAEDLNYIMVERKSTVKIEGEPYQFYSMVHGETNEQVQVLVCNEPVRQVVKNRLLKMMMPTIFIPVGMLAENMRHYSSNCIETISFGQIHKNSKEDVIKSFDTSIKKIKRNLKSTIALAASEAHESLMKTLGEPEDIDKSYDDKIFEDDVFAVIRDLIPNCEKWGKEKSGKVFPEGIFAISAKKGKKSEPIKKVYSFDCKFTTKNQGYDLNKGEQRKAVDYVEKLNNNPYVEKFSSSEELTAHIFISNRFQEQQKEGMDTHFYEKLEDGYNTRAVFITIDAFLHLHKMYLENIEVVQRSQNLFFLHLMNILEQETVTKDAIDKMFSKVLDEELSERKELNTKKVTVAMAE